MGRAYVSSVFISGLLALALVFYVENFAKATGFLALSLLWIFTCWKGYRSAVRKNFEEHRKWMIRSFGVTLVAVSGRLVVPVLLLTYYIVNGFSLPAGRAGMVEEVLNVNIWVGLLVNFIIVEWIILNDRRGVTR
jgi:membrane protease YdiL (CAAX protease family)